MNKKVSSESLIKDIRRRTRKKYSSEEKIRIVLEGLRGEDSIANLCRREGIPSNLYYRWSKDFLEAGKKRLMGDTAREANSQEVTNIKKENEHLKQLVAEIALKNRVLKKSLNGTDFEDIEDQLGEDYKAVDIEIFSKIQRTPLGKIIKELN
jgi:transposase